MAKINKRSKKIFDILKAHPEGITGNFISHQLGVSSRTIRSDIKLLQENLSEYNVEIVSSPNIGYKFKSFANLNIVERKIFSVDKYSLESSQERVNRIILRLLENTFHDSAITQNDLADEMFISLSTLKTHLNEAKAILKKYDLEIAQYKTKGIKVIGNEIKIRYCISEYIDFYNLDKVYQKIFSNVNINQIDKIIKEVLSAKNLQLADNAKENLCVHTAIAIQRFRYNKLVSYPASLANKIENTFEYNVAKEIVEKIYKENNTDLSYAEVYYIAQCLLASKKVFDVGESPDKAHVKELVNIILQEINEKLSIDFTDDEYLVDGLALHLNIALTRIQFQMNITNELLETIKNDYPLAFQMGVIAGKVVEKHDHIKINENEIGYIALHFGAALSRNNITKSIHTKNIIVVCSSGLSIAILLKAKIREYFNNRLNITKILPGYEVTPQILDDIDFVLTTVPLKNIKSDKIIHINHMLGKDDIKIIEEKILKDSEEDFNKFIKFFNKDNFYINKEFNTKEECIEFLTNEAIKKGLMNLKGKQSVFEREEMSATSIGDLAAVPHPIYNEQNISFISILVLNKPILWSDLLVQVVFLLNIERSKADLWEIIFLKLYEYIKSKNGINSILEHKSFKVFIDEFIQMF